MRNPVISICKGIAIILMVMGHAEPPTLISNFIYIFHMPLFFITAGYFFSRKYLADPWSFIARRFKGLYLPFLKWSIFFLVLHNLWFEVGLLNEQFGNWTGGVTHPYTWRQFFHRLFLIVTSMSGYDEFMAGAFWFFRGLLVASVLFLLLYKLIDDHTRLTPVWGVVAVCAVAWAFQAYRLGFGLKITTIPNGGLREIWGMFFFGVGVLYRQFEPRIGCRWWVTLLCLAVMCVGAWNHFCGMNNSGTPRDLITLPLTGIAGFLATRHLAGILAARFLPDDPSATATAKSGFAVNGFGSDVKGLGVVASWFGSVVTRLRSVVSRVGMVVTRLLRYIGDNTLYVFIFHIISFKVVSQLKIWWYGLEQAQIGCHMVIHYNNHTDLFWLLYTVAGVSLPLLALTLYRRLHTKLHPHIANTLRPLLTRLRPE